MSDRRSTDRRSGEDRRQAPRAIDPDRRYTTRRSGVDRRQSPRHEDRFCVRLLADGEEPGELCELCDVSLGGMAILPPREPDLRRGSTAVVEFPLGRSASRIRTRCHVVDVSRKAPGSECRIHLQFLDASRFFRETLASCIQAWEARPLPDRRGEP